MAFAPPGKFLIFVARARIGEFPDEEAEDELRSQKRDSGFRHRLRHLLVNRRSVGRDILRHPPGVPQDGNRRNNRNQEDGDCEEFRHVAPRLERVYSDPPDSASQPPFATAADRSLPYFADLTSP